MRILGLDVGERRIGVAISDPTNTIAQPLIVIERDGKELDRLSVIVRDNDVGEIVIGYPRNMDGSSGATAEKVKEFAEGLSKMIDVPFVFVDERLSTAEAERMMITADLSRKKRKKSIDKVAAAIILEGRLRRI
ncbi:MAG: Holliday junction resolvase RuvX [Deltaproteobacteria bacterium]|uniref:Putative pre-16S rRNA nuclease n=1 Tax=Candidatus Zymogenus saltonus TaxID=2844893 RepID=A0A9D8PLZ3_9DELT|nr:Holliday junction resolvase RuvX [Candidatus Zymogenus saltonus]